MDEKKQKIKKFIDDANIPADLKAKELEIVNNPELNSAEVILELTKLLSGHMDTRAAELGVTDVPDSPDTKEAEAAFEVASADAERDLELDFALVDESSKAIRQVAEEIEKVALKESLTAAN